MRDLALGVALLSSELEPRGSLVVKESGAHLTAKGRIIRTFARACG